MATTKNMFDKLNLDLKETLAKQEKGGKADFGQKTQDLKLTPPKKPELTSEDVLRLLQDKGNILTR